jgi:hypothetical protein
MPLGACGLFLVCAAFNPHPAFSTVLFLLSLLGCIFFHYVQVIQRKRLSVAEPHSSSAGDSWNIWQTQGLTKTTVKRYVEPALCMAVGLLVSLPDRFLGCWLVASAVALFVKEQQSRFKIGRRIMDSIDAKHEAQALNNSLKQQQPAPGQGAQKSHRAHFPRSGQHPHP